MKLAFALLCSLALAGCGGRAAAPAVATPPPAASARPPVPPCPESILAGGDPLESLGFEGKPVVRVCVVGGSAASRQAAQRAVEHRTSDVFSEELVRADLAAILKLGTFDDASAYGLRVQQGASVVLLYSVHDRPRIADIAFVGAKVLGDANMNRGLADQKETPYDPAKASAMALAARDEYRQRGYEAARVVVVAEPVASSPDHVRVRLQVDEGAPSRFAKIAFRGNKKVSEAELRKAVGLQTNAPFVRDEIERASLGVSALYFDRGFVQVRVDAEVGASDPQGGLPLTFVVEEGDAYSVGALHVTKLGAPFEKEILEKVVRARPKQVFVRSLVAEDLARVSAFFEARKKRVVVTPLTELDPKKKTIDLTLEIDEQP